MSGLGMLELTYCKAVPPQGRSKHHIPTCDKGMKGVGKATPLHEGSGSVAPEFLGESVSLVSLRTLPTGGKA